MPMEFMASAAKPCVEELAAMWSPLAWVALDLRLVAREPILLPEHSGSTLRGVFGRGLREVACLAAPPACSSCVHPDSCLYQSIFESRTPPRAEVLSRNSHVSPPFAIRSPVGRRLAPGDDFAFRLILVGRAASSAAHAIEAFRRMGKAGIGSGRGRFGLAEVRAQAPDGSSRLLYDGSRGIGRASAHAAPAWLAAAGPLDGRAIEVEFETPTELRERGHALASPPFSSLVRAILRRLTTLSHFYCDGPARFDVHPWLDLAAGVEHQGGDLRPTAWSRWSSRQGRWVPMHGIVGRARYSPAPAALLPLLRLGEWLHVGKGATGGLGAIRVRPVGEAA